jgi:effector-binding domain-containing protein
VNALTSRTGQEDIMIDTPTIAQTAEQPTAVVHLTIPKDAIRQEMGPAREEVMRALAAQGVTPAGPWFSRHFRIDPAEWDFEVGVPVTAPIAAAGRVRNSALPATRVARTNYRGGFEGLGAGWGEFDAWIAGEGLRHDGSLWESYAAGPESGNDPAGWRTELNRPLTP